jgi:uncharacterized protein YdeI (BOF family)
VHVAHENITPETFLLLFPFKLGIEVNSHSCRRFIMDLSFATLLAFLTTLAAPAIATAQTTIGELQQANSVTLSGEVLRVQGDDFILSDGTGQIWVEAERRPIREAGLKVGDRVTVAGVYDDENSFEALSITPAGGTVIYVFDD